jgi:hypothetical protein
MANAHILADALVPELAAQGAAAVALTGSHARGEAMPGSDLDLLVVGDGPAYRIDVRDGVLVAQSWATEDEHRARLNRPAAVGTCVPGWRAAVVLHDPSGIAGRLRQEALEWSWDPLGEDCDRWVAEEITGLAEEAFKIRAALRQGRMLMAAVQRTVVALRLAPILAVHHRMLYGTENVLWDVVGERMGPEWRRVQAAALATRSEPLDAGCAAALELFGMATRSVWELMDARQRAVVSQALSPK